MAIWRPTPGGWVTDTQSGIGRATPGGVLLAVSDEPFTFDESLRPNAITLTNLTGAYTDIDDDPDAPDGNWLTA